MLYAYSTDENGELDTSWATPYYPVTIQYYLRSGDACTLVEDNGATLWVNKDNGWTLEKGVTLSTFEHNDGLWRANTLALVFEMELADGYELEAVKYEDASGSGDVQLIAENYGVIPSGTLTLKIYTIDTTAPQENPGCDPGYDTTEPKEEPITIVGGTDDTEVTVQIPAEEAEKVEGLTLIVEELDEAVEEKAVSLFVKNLDTEEDYIYILDIYFENADGEKTEVNATMTVTVPVPEGWAAKNVGVYYVNPDTGEVVDMKAVASADGKTLTFTTDHFSYYALVLQATIPANGDDSGVTLWVVLLAASCCGLAALPLLSKKRQRI